MSNIANPRAETLYGFPQPNQRQTPAPIIALRPPATTDLGYPLGQLWVDKAIGHSYQLNQITTGSANWVQIGSATGALSTLTGDTGTASPSSNNILIAGGTNLTTAASGSTVTVNLDAAISGLTSIGATTFFTSPTTSRLSISGTTLSTSGTDANIPVVILSKGVSAVSCSRSADGSVLAFQIENTSNTAVSAAQIQVGVAGSTAADAFQTFYISSGENWSIGLDNSASDAFVISEDSSLGSNNAVSFAPTTRNATFSGSVTTTALTATTGNIGSSAGSVSAATTVTAGTGLIATTGGVTVNGGDIINSHSSAAADVTIEVTNSDNTSGTSRAGIEIATGGTSSGDPYLQFLISGGQVFTMGIDNSSGGDGFLISKSATLGTTNQFAIDGTSGDIFVSSGNLSIEGSAKQLKIKGSAVTDFIGQAVLINGEVTVANTNMSANDRISVTRSAKNASSAYGVFQVVITASTNFVITSCKSDTTTETNDQSTVDYVIIRQT